MTAEWMWFLHLDSRLKCKIYYASPFCSLPIILYLVCRFVQSEQKIIHISKHFIHQYNNYIYYCCEMDGLWWIFWLQGGVESWFIKKNWPIGEVFDDGQMIDISLSFFHVNWKRMVYIQCLYLQFALPMILFNQPHASKVASSSGKERTQIVVFVNFRVPGIFWLSFCCCCCYLFLFLTVWL